MQQSRRFVLKAAAFPVVGSFVLVFWRTSLNAGGGMWSTFTEQRDAEDNALFVYSLIIMGCSEWLP